MSSILSLARLFKHVGSITGRKKLQKIVHLLQASGTLDFKVPFSLCHYGAFSSTLARELDMLIDSGFIKTEPEQVGAYQSQAYSADGSLMEFLESESIDEQNDQWAPLAQELVNMSMQKLEALSTVVYLRQAGWINLNLHQRFSDLKPHLTEFFEFAEKRSRTFPIIPIHNHM